MFKLGKINRFKLRSFVYLVWILGNSKRKGHISADLIYFIMEAGHLQRSTKYFRVRLRNFSDQYLLIRADGTTRT
jgi:hypothetical protein